MGKDYTEPYETPYLQELRKRGIRLPAVLCQMRTDEGQEKRRMGIEAFRYKFLTPRTDGMANTLTGVLKDNLLMTKQDMETELTYKENPTKEDLLDFYERSGRIRIRKMTEDEAGRLMGLFDCEIEKINAWPFATMAERKEAITKADRKELARIKKESICKTAKYKMYGNSIVVDCLYHLFRTMFLPGQPGHEARMNDGRRVHQMDIFEILN